jgi:hypothetical protein
MALIVADRVQETTTTTGTGTYTLSGAKDGFQSFGAVGDGNTTYYACTDGTDYEVGIGTYTASGTTLARTTIIESSNSDAAVNWGAGSKDIFVTAPADKTLLVGRNLYADNPSSATMPSVTGANAIGIGDSTTSSGTGSVAIGFGADASNTHNIAIGYNSEASTGVYNYAFGFGATANASYYAVAIGSTNGGVGSIAGGNGSFATSGGVTAGNHAQALGKAYASGADSFAAAIANNSSSYGAQGANGVAIGLQAKTLGAQGLALGAYSQAAQTEAVALGGGYAQGVKSISIGSSSHATSTYGCAIGYDTTAVGSALALGTQANAQQGYSVAIHRGKSEVQGKIAFSGTLFSTIGDAQGGSFVLVADTTDATATVLTTNNSTAASTNQIVAASDTCITFDGTITAMQNGAQAYASWKIEGLLVNDGGTTSLVNSATTVISNADGWGMALSADTGNNALAITVTGEASHNIRWVANIRTTEVTYA